MRRFATSPSGTSRVALAVPPCQFRYSPAGRIQSEVWRDWRVGLGFEWKAAVAYEQCRCRSKLPASNAPLPRCTPASRERWRPCPGRLQYGCVLKQRTRVEVQSRRKVPGIPSPQAMTSGSCERATPVANRGMSRLLCRLESMEKVLARAGVIRIVCCVGRHRWPPTTDTFDRGSRCEPTIQSTARV